MVTKCKWIFWTLDWSMSQSRNNSVYGHPGHWFKSMNVEENIQIRNVWHLCC